MVAPRRTGKVVGPETQKTWMMTVRSQCADGVKGNTTIGHEKNRSIIDVSNENDRQAPLKARRASGKNSTEVTGRTESDGYPQVRGYGRERVRDLYRRNETCLRVTRRR
jgi:hypothetical protein